jgi:hypothetical protein
METLAEVVPNEPNIGTFVKAGLAGCTEEANAAAADADIVRTATSTSRIK